MYFLIFICSLIPTCRLIVARTWILINYEATTVDLNPFLTTQRFWTNPTCPDTGAVGRCVSEEDPSSWWSSSSVVELTSSSCAERWPWAWREETFLRSYSCWAAWVWTSTTAPSVWGASNWVAWMPPGLAPCWQKREGQTVCVVSTVREKCFIIFTNNRNVFIIFIIFIILVCPVFQGKGLTLARYIHSLQRSKSVSGPARSVADPLLTSGYISDESDDSCFSFVSTDDCLFFNDDLESDGTVLSLVVKNTIMKWLSYDCRTTVVRLCSCTTVTHTLNIVLGQMLACDSP